MTLGDVDTSMYRHRGYGAQLVVMAFLNALRHNKHLTCLFMLATLAPHYRSCFISFALLFHIFLVQPTFPLISLESRIPCAPSHLFSSLYSYCPPSSFSFLAFWSIIRTSHNLSHYSLQNSKHACLYNKPCHCALRPAPYQPGCFLSSRGR